MSSKATSVKIRMYNTGSVGDCFLLLFQKGNNISFRMMIDCGGIKTTAAKVDPVVEDIKATCGGVLDLLVVTHEHEDHISGFNISKEKFDGIKVKEVWMSWVERETDPVAIILKDKLGKKIKELKKKTAGALQELKGFSYSSRSIKGARTRLGILRQNMEQALGLLEFEEGLSHGPNLAAGRRTNSDAMKYVKKKGQKIDYKVPGEIANNVAGAEGIKFYFLGPPREKDLKHLKMDEVEAEMYHVAVDSNGRKVTEENNDEESLLVSGISLEEGVSPFASEFLMEGKQKTAFFKEYYSKELKWRQIETDWLESSTDLALALTDFVNNTSLAMALEFEDSGRVILLPADAQSGNWMSWHLAQVSQKFKAKGGRDTNELLANTVFVKVGHHGSHNGTASKSGLDKMNHEDLVAFIPLVQEKVPKAWGGAKNFPAIPLYKELIKKTKGRIIRTDQGLITDLDAKKLRSQLSSTEKNELKNSYVSNGIYFEYEVKGK